jgi:4-aminobutyrate aminotransferase-like enzyme
MGYEATKTEHAGAQRGRGAYCGVKADAKRESNRRRREDAKAVTSEALRNLKSCAEVES